MLNLQAAAAWRSQAAAACKFNILLLAKLKWTRGFVPLRSIFETEYFEISKI